MKELKSREVLFNRYQFMYLFFLSIGVMAILLDVYIFNDFGIFFILGILLTILYFSVILTAPIYYVYDKEKLSIIHACGIKEKIYYKDIRWIREGYLVFRSSLPAYKYFEIYYPHKEKFLLKGEVCKSKKAKRLLEYYTKKEIE